MCRWSTTATIWRRFRRPSKPPRRITDKPSLIRVRTVIGYGSPKAGTNKAHGEALGPEAAKATKKNLNWPEDKTFYVPDEARANWLQAVDKGKKYEQEWNDLFARYKKEFPDLAAEFERVQSGELASGWEKSLPVFPADAKPIATRSAGGEVMDAISQSGARADWGRGRSRPPRPRPF